jgi:hypothetical protein
MEMMMDSIEHFFKKTNFDTLIKQALEKDIIYISQNTDQAISGFGLCTNWTIDCSPSEFWLTSLLTEEGVDDLDVEDIYATGSWDGFDQGCHSESSKITDRIYAEMWSAREEHDDEDKLYERVRIRCAEILVSCIPLIKESFTTTDAFLVSIAEHDEEIEAKERMSTLVNA